MNAILNKEIVVNPKYLLAKEVADKHFPDWNYTIPNLHDPKARFFMGLSGGVDSACLAFVMLAKHPELIPKTELIFCDTGVEPWQCHDILDQIEEMFGMNVTRLADQTLFDLIEKGNGFLPSPRQRNCTKTLKIDPWNKHLQNNVLGDDPDAYAINFVGIRYDERERRGAIGLDRVETYFPFVDQKVVRETVCAAASEIGLMSSVYYLGRSRSGCTICFFAAKSELISLLLWDHKSFKSGAKCERLSEAITERLTSDIGQGMDWGLETTYPFSELITKGKGAYEDTNLLGEIIRTDASGQITWDIAPNVVHRRTKNRKVDDRTLSLLSDLGEESSCEGESQNSNSDKEPDLLEIVEEERVLYVAIENYLDSRMALFGCSNPVWSQRLITYSTTSSGLAAQLKGYSYHRILASRFMWSSDASYEDSSHITVLAIRFPKGVIPTINYVGDNYTWSDGRSYLEIAHTVRQIERVCNLHCSTELLKTRGRMKERGLRIIQEHWQSGCIDYGSIIGIGHYRPLPVQENIDFSLDETLENTRCAICSI